MPHDGHVVSPSVHTVRDTAAHSSSPCVDPRVKTASLPHDGHVVSPSVHTVRDTPCVDPRVTASLPHDGHVVPPSVHTVRDIAAHSFSPCVDPRVKTASLPHDGHVVSPPVHTVRDTPAHFSSPARTQFVAHKRQTSDRGLNGKPFNVFKFDDLPAANAGIDESLLWPQSHMNHILWDISTGAKKLQCFQPRRVNVLKTVQKKYNRPDLLI